MFKKGKSCDVNDYRSISQLSIPGKILEAVLCNSVNNYLQPQPAGLQKKSFNRGSLASYDGNLEVSSELRSGSGSTFCRLPESL